MPAGAGGRARAPGVSPQRVVHLLPQLLSGHLKERIKYLFVFIKRHALDAIYRRILILQFGLHYFIGIIKVANYQSRIYTQVSESFSSFWVLK